MLFKNRLSAMTMAEVMLTLVIVGVIAALTIPGLKKASQRDTTVVQLKKGYRTLNGALDLAFAENLDLKINSGEAVFKEYMVPKMVVNQYCEASNMSKCYPSLVKDLDLTPTVAVQLADGNSIAVSGDFFIVDVNGPEMPNIEGVDVFYYKLEKVSNSVAMNAPQNPLIAFFKSFFGAPAYAVKQENYQDYDTTTSCFSVPSSSSSYGSSTSSTSSGVHREDIDKMDNSSSSSSGTTSSTSSGTSSSTSSSTSSGTTSSTSSGSSSGSSSGTSSSGGVSNDYTSLSASGWQFVPQGSAVKVMDAGWKIKYW